MIKRLVFFERYLTLWMFLCMIVGVALGKLLPDCSAALSRFYCSCLSGFPAYRSVAPTSCGTFANHKSQVTKD